MSSPESGGPLAPADQATLLRLARASVAHGLRHGAPPAVEWEALSPALRETGAAFVTIEKNGALRGCIGSLEATRPLATDVVANAFMAAFRDPRFPPVTAEELDQLTLKISVLSPPDRMEVASEADLLAQLRPGVDGLILAEGARRATFLPSVWEDLPDPVRFLRHLKLKGGWPEGYWSDRMEAYRYTAQVIA